MNINIVYGIVIVGTYLLILFVWWMITWTTYGRVNYAELIKTAGVILAIYTGFCLMAWAMLIASYWIGRL